MIDAEAEAPIVWPPDAKSQLMGKDPDAGKDWRLEEKGTTGWDGWMASPMHMNLSKLQVLVMGGLVCYSPWGCKESDMTERLYWTEQISTDKCIYVLLCNNCVYGYMCTCTTPRGRLFETMKLFASDRKAGGETHGSGCWVTYNMRLWWSRSLPSTQRLDVRENKKHIFHTGENQELKEQNILRGPLKSYHFYPTSVFATMIANSFLTINSDSTANVWNCINEEFSAYLYPSII